MLPSVAVRRSISSSSSGATRTWSAGLVRWALGSGVILAGAAAVQQFGRCCSFSLRPSIDADEAAIRRAFRSRLLGGDSAEVRVSLVSYSRLQQLVATDQINEVHVCPADNALYAFEPARNSNTYRCYAVRADCNCRRCRRCSGLTSSTDCGQAERLAEQLAKFRQRLTVADKQRGLSKQSTPLRIAWCSGPVLGDLSATPVMQFSLATLLTPASVACIAAWGGVCLRWRVFYLALPLATLYTLPVLILREQK